MTTATIDTTAKRREVQSLLERARTRASRAKASLGRAALDGNPGKARENLATATLAVEEQEAVLARLDEIDAQRADRDKRLALATERVAAYQYAVKWCDEAAELIQLRAAAQAAEEAAEAAEDRLAKIATPPAVHRIQRALGPAPEHLDGGVIRLSGFGGHIANRERIRATQAQLRLPAASDFGQLKNQAAALLAQAQADFAAIEREDIQ